MLVSGLMSINCVVRHHLMTVQGTDDYESAIKYSLFLKNIQQLFYVKVLNK